jgi:hypothetical protein
MKGKRRTGQEALFYEFSLEWHVPETPLLRSIDRFVDPDGVWCEMAPLQRGGSASNPQGPRLLGTP